ncbi:MAG: triose-phosphate isomerase [Thiohalocapsa sp.]|jgi:triosephosphate isomerase|uniref:triose-phosphate isomerase n=1 Tax=Thiohalocapsa sp. TaxID=2497641 RepID=UPI0025E30C4A|nr:triose-phosphate isomerase [Thiohalocapsa sp.]MCG6940138.1 triose-phosphate isomerase [Thiohalocapsa sp.]
MRRPLIAGNWKMNGTKADAAELVRGIVAGVSGMQKTDVAVCPPFPYLYLVEELLQGTAIGWGSQDVSCEDGGAFTGQVSAAMLKDFGCRYAIVGHSERRQLNGETDGVIARKYAQAVANGLVPILCVGETLEEREQGKTEEVVAKHIDGVLNLEGVDAYAHGVVAYEPVWAIGTGVTATPAQAQEVHAFLRERIAKKSKEIAKGLRILYGGSMKPGNAAELIGQPDIDGGLIGGASLNAADFVAICQAGEDNA